jgi:hypothetical protein
MQSANKAGPPKPIITKGVEGRPELRIIPSRYPFPDRNTFEIYMTRFKAPPEPFIDAVILAEKFRRADGVKDAVSKYERSAVTGGTHISLQGEYMEPMTSKGIEELYGRLCKKLERRTILRRLKSLIYSRSV